MDANSIGAYKLREEVANLLHHDDFGPIPEPPDERYEPGLSDVELTRVEAGRPGWQLIGHGCHRKLRYPSDR